MNKTKNKQSDSSYLPKEMVDDLLDWIKDVYENDKISDDEKEKIISIIRNHKEKSSCRKLSKGFALFSHKTYRKILNNTYRIGYKYATKKRIIIDELSETMFYYFYDVHNQMCSRKLLDEKINNHEFIMNDEVSHIKYSDRQITNLMNQFGLKFLGEFKRTRKQKEHKDTKFICPGLVERDCHNRLHSVPIIATDVTYIDAPKDVKNSNYVYLSVAISHKTKMVTYHSIFQQSTILI